MLLRGVDEPAIVGQQLIRADPQGAAPLPRG